MRGPPGVVVVLPRVGPGLDRGEAVAAVVVGEHAAHPGEVRVDRRGVLVALVDVAPGGVGLPDLDQLAAHGAAVAVDDPTGHHDPLADRLTAVLDGQVGLGGADVAVPEDRREQLDLLGVGVVQVLGRVAQEAAAVRRVVQPRLRLVAARTCSCSCAIAAISSLISSCVESCSGSHDPTVRRIARRDRPADFH